MVTNQFDRLLTVFLDLLKKEIEDGLGEAVLSDEEKSQIARLISKHVARFNWDGARRAKDQGASKFIQKDFMELNHKYYNWRGKFLRGIHIRTKPDVPEPAFWQTGREMRVMIEEARFDFV